MNRVLALLPLIALLSWPAGASAELPSPKSTTIVPGQSIAGVSVGMSVERALKLWGSGSTCTKESVRTSCDWRGTQRQGSAGFFVDERGKVTLVQISAGQDKTYNVVYTGPLQKWRARKKVRLGVTVRTVLKAYPKLHGSPSGAALGTGRRTTTFSTSSGRIYQISLGVLP